MKEMISRWVMSPGLSSWWRPSPHATRTRTRARARQVQIPVLQQTLTFKVVLKTSIKNTTMVLKLLTFFVPRVCPGAEAFLFKATGADQEQVELPSSQYTTSIFSAASSVSSRVLDLVQDSHYKSTCI